MATPAADAPPPGPGAQAAAAASAAPGVAAGSGSGAEAVAQAGAGGVAPDATDAPAPKIVRAAALIAGLTVLSRLVGFGRIVVFSYAVGVTTLGSVYQTANTIPNIIFEIVASGALAALVVPLVAGAIVRGDRDEVGQTASGLLTWVLLLLTPLALVLVAVAHPVIWLLDPHGSPDELRVGATMLRVFAPQLPLYGVGIVLTGVLQAYRRFAWPVIAPLLSSLTVVGAYLCFAAVEPGGVDIPLVGRGGQLVLSLGTTLGVAVLSLCLILPVRRLGLRIRPTLRLGAPARRAVRGLAGVGVITAAAQQLTLGLAIALANWDTASGSAVLFAQAQTVYLVPWAVLAVPVATSAYPALATAVATGAAQRLRDTLASATRSVLLLCALGGAALIALAWPMAWILVHSAKQAPVGVLSASIIGFAPGLFGYGLFALHSRALYARRDNRWAALATVAGWGAVAVASVLVALLVPASDRVPALTAANSAGMLLLAVVLVVLVGRRFGAGALAGVRRAAGTALLAGTLAAAAGIVARWPVRGTPGYAGAVLGGMLSGIAVAVVFVGVVLLVDSRDARPMLARLVRRVSAGRRGGVATTAPGGTGEPVRGGATASAGQTEPAEQTKGDR